MTNRLVPIAWLVVMMLVSVTIVSACSGGGSPDQATATAPPPSTPTNASEPTISAEPSSELGPDILEYVDALCGMRDLDFSRETWGDVGDGFQISIEYLQSLDTPEELEGMISALQARYRLDLDFVRGQDPNEPVNYDEFGEFRETAEAKALEEAYHEEEEAVDPEILAALNEC